MPQRPHTRPDVSHSDGPSGRLHPVILQGRLADLVPAVEIDEARSNAHLSLLRVAGPESIEVLTRLHDDEALAMRCLVDLTAVDRLGLDSPGEERFVVVYVLRSPTNQHRIRVEVSVGGEEPSIESVTGLWPAAAWLECEVFDLFGIRFRGHPDLRRILLDPDFEGAPLRKDHPLQIERRPDGAIADDAS